MELVASPRIAKPADWNIEPDLTAAPGLWQGLRLVIAHRPFSSPRNIVNGALPTAIVGTGATEGVGLYGSQAEAPSSDVADNYGLRYAVPGTTDRTMAVVVMPFGVLAASVDRHVMNVGHTNGSDPAISIVWDQTNTRWKGVSSTNIFSAAGSAPANQWAVVVASVRAQPGKKLYLNGLLAGSDTTANAPATETALGIMTRWEANTGDVEKFRGLLAGAWYWDRALSDLEVATFSADPFATVRPARRRRAFVAVGAPAGPRIVVTANNDIQ